MRAIFLVSRQPTNAIDKWAASLQTPGATVKHITAWTCPGGLQQRHGACADPFLLSSGATGASLEAHLAQYHSSDALLLVSLDLSQPSLPRSGFVLLVWQPQVPQDIVAQCNALVQGLPNAGCIKGLLLAEASPSLTLSVTHKALEAAGLQALARKPTVIVPRGAQAAVQAITGLADTLPSVPPTLVSQWTESVCGSSSVRIAVARDDAFGPCFQENLTLLQQAGAQLVFFSPLYDTCIPSGATCLYLSSGPLDPERWQQLATNRPLLAAVRAFCDAGGMVLAEGAGLLYLSRTVDLEAEEEHTHQRHVHEMAGVLPFKTCLLPEPQTAAVEVHVAAGNPLLPAGGRLRGYLSAQASIVLVEERQLQSLILATLGHHAGSGHHAGKASSHGTHMSTTYEVNVVQPEQQQQQQGEGVAATEVAVTVVMPRTDAGPAQAQPEGYTIGNVLASSCLLFLPSQPGLVTHLVSRCACIDAGALAAGMAHQLGCSGMVPSASKLHLHSALGSANCSRGSSRRQSIQDVSAWGAAYGSNSGVGGAGGAMGMHGFAGDGGMHHSHSHPCGHGAAHHHLPHHPAAPNGSACGGHALSARGSAASLASSCLPPSRSSLHGPAALPHDHGFPLDGCPRAHQRPPLHHSCANGAPNGVASTSSRPSQEYAVGHSGASRLLLPPQQVGKCSSSACDDAAASSRSCFNSSACAASCGAPPEVGDAHKAAPGRSPRWPCSTACEAAGHCEHLPPVQEHSCSSYATELAALPTSGPHTSRAAMSRVASDHSLSSHGYDLGCYGSEGPVHSRAGSISGWSPHPAAALRHGPVGLLGSLAAGAGHGGVVCCAPGACEALVAMGLGNRLAGVGSDCDYPPDVCSKHRVVFGWAAPEEAPQGAAARGIRVIHPIAGSSGNLCAAFASCAAGSGGNAAGRGCRPSVDRVGPRGGGAVAGRVLLLDELALRQESPAVLVLPDPAELSFGEQAQLEQALVETGLVSPGGGPAGAGCIMHASCHSLVDVMDLVLELGAAAGEPHAASMLLERLQARLRRVQAAAAGAPVRPSIMAAAAVAPSPLPASPPLPRCPRVLVLQSLQPLVEPGRWVPEMLAMVGASACLALPGGPNVQLTWQDVRERAAPDVLIILAPSDGLASAGTPSASAAGGGAASSCGSLQGASGLQEQLAALAAQPGWWCLPAVRSSRVYLMQSEYCVRAGPRLVDGVELLARLLMPGQYTSSRKAPAGALLRLSLAAGQRCRATLLPSYFVPVMLD